MGSQVGGASVKLIVVGVDAQGNPTVDFANVDLWSTLGDQCKWVSSNISFQINFAAGSPFGASKFSGTSVASGALQPGATGAYKYSVQVGSKILDPQISVHP